MTLHYVFNTEAQAISAENKINALAEYPRYSRNAKTNQIDETAQSTVRWAVPWERATDNKWVFPVVPISLMLLIFTQEQVEQIITQFNIEHPHAEENIVDDWIINNES